MKYIYTTVSFLLLFTSCRKTIDIKLKDADKRIVVEAKLTSGTSDFNMKISKTRNFFGKSSKNTVIDASVFLFDGVNTYSLTNIGSGNYKLPLFTVLENKKYKLSVSTNGAVYEASSHVPSKIEIKKISYLFEDVSIFSGEGFVLNVEFQDPKSEANYYRIDGTINGKKFGEVNEIILFDDLLENGELISYPVLGELKLGDEVLVNLYHISSSTYNYYKELSLIVSGEGDEVSPTNPVSNWTNNALGSFNTMAVSKKTIVIQ